MVNVIWEHLSRSHRRNVFVWRGLYSVLRVLSAVHINTLSVLSRFPSVHPVVHFFFSVEQAVGVIRQAFSSFDKDGKGFVSATDISRVLAESGEGSLSEEVRQGAADGKAGYVTYK